jgi:hypothetical protein
LDRTIGTKIAFGPSVAVSHRLRTALLSVGQSELVAGCPCVLLSACAVSAPVTYRGRPAQCKIIHAGPSLRTGRSLAWLGGVNPKPSIPPRDHGSVARWTRCRPLAGSRRVAGLTSPGHAKTITASRDGLVDANSARGAHGRAFRGSGGPSCASASGTLRLFTAATSVTACRNPADVLLTSGPDDPARRTTRPVQSPTRSYPLPRPRCHSSHRSLWCVWRCGRSSTWQTRRTSRWSVVRLFVGPPRGTARRCCWPTGHAAALGQTWRRWMSSHAVAQQAGSTAGYVPRPTRRPRLAVVQRVSAHRHGLRLVGCRHPPPVNRG